MVSYDMRYELQQHIGATNKHLSMKYQKSIKTAGEATMLPLTRRATWQGEAPAHRSGKACSYNKGPLSVADSSST